MGQEVDSLAKWLDIGALLGQTGFESHDKRELFFNYASFLFLRLLCRKISKI